MTLMRKAVLAACLGGGVHALAVAEESGDQLAIAPPNVIEEIVVLGQFIPDEKRETSEISNVLDEEALSILSDSTVGQALSRVTGLSLVGGKYVYVRGLGERYSSTLLNGARISSPVPFQKTVPLDIVPNSIVRNLLVQKTFSSQYPGDFSGGLVDIRTKATPDETFLTIGVSGGGNSVTTLGDGLTYNGGTRDRLGYDDGTRDIPTNIKNLTGDQFQAIEDPQRRGLGASFFNFWDVKETEYEPNVSGEVEGGTRFQFDNGSALGILAAAKYQHQYTIRNKDLRRYEFGSIDSTGLPIELLTQSTNREQVNASGFLNLGYEIDTNNTLSLTSVILRQTEDDVQRTFGLSSESDVADGAPVDSYRLQFTENQIISHQLTGEHYFPFLNDARLAWRAVDGTGERNSPDRRTYTYEDLDRDGLFRVIDANNQLFDFGTVFSSPDRNFARLKDEITEYGVDLELPFAVGPVDLQFNLGWSDLERQRTSSDRLFRFTIPTSAPDYVTLQTPSQLFGLENWAEGFVEVADFSDASTAVGIFPFAESSEETEAFYGAVDLQLTPRIRIQGGVRREETTLSSDSFGGSVEPGTSNANNQTFTNTLPSASITYEFINDMQIRLAASETVNLPSLLEITDSTIRNPEDYQFYRGNGNLKPATVENLDLRWEWYFGNADSMSIGVFRKNFDDPIELGELNAATVTFSWFNAEEAELEGVEWEVRKDLYLSSWFGLPDAFEYFTLNANLSYIDSELTFPDVIESTPTGTPFRGIPRRFNQLSGQSDWLGNIILSYQNYESGLEGSITYNYTGKRIVLPGSQNAPDVIERPFGKVDLLLKYRFFVMDSELELELKVQNLFDEDVEWVRGGQTWEAYNDGVFYSFGVKATL